MTQEKPPKIWISNASLKQSTRDGVGFFFPNFPGDGGKFDLLEYVPAGEKDAEIERLNEQLIVARLEIARLKVQPIVDNERESENLGDVMNIRFTSGK